MSDKRGWGLVGSRVSEAVAQRIAALSGRADVKPKGGTVVGSAKAEYGRGESMLEAVWRMRRGDRP